MRRWGPDASIAKGSKEWELIPEIKQLVKNSPAVEKNTYDAIVNTNLATLLKEHEIERVVICEVILTALATPLDEVVSIAVTKRG